MNIILESIKQIDVRCCIIVINNLSSKEKR